jgi:hypothetical protein
MLALSALAAASYMHEALFDVAAAALLLLFIGIHNAWDAVSYHVFVNTRDKEGESRQEGISKGTCHDPSHRKQLPAQAVD